MDLFSNNSNSTTAGGAVPAISNRVYIFVGIMILLVIVVLAYMYFRPKAEDVTVMGPYDLMGVSGAARSDQVTLFDQSQLSTQTGNNFTLSMFVYMDEFNAERIPIGGPRGDFRFKPLLSILGVGTVTLDPIHQMARVTLQPLADSGILKRDSRYIVDISDVVVARWNQLVVSVEGRSVDVYLNGNLIKSALMENVPILYPVGVLLETVPDFSGQAGLFQAWPRRLSMEEVQRNYKKNVDLRGKPRIPEKTINFADLLARLREAICSAGFCGYNFEVGPLAYVDYEYA
jgi:hypothetical protein